MKTVAGETASWKRDFPVRWDDDRRVTRREFGRFLAFASLGMALATALTALVPWLRRPARRAARRIGAVADVRVGGYRLFRYPTEHDPAILLRLAESRFVAYSQLCTHLSCPVHPSQDRRQLVCPCHHGIFAADDGRVLGGPPQRALPRIALSVKDGEVWAEETAA
ncbi:MAG: Rieske (2Fe-2S) protein [Deltaproteobacteria bacterium]|nr:Rieske (2Fe-2S) protein [Deltaproteobacteria bacterium]